MFSLYSEEDGVRKEFSEVDLAVSDDHFEFKRFYPGTRQASIYVPDFVYQQVDPTDPTKAGASPKDSWLVTLTGALVVNYTRASRNEPPFTLHIYPRFKLGELQCWNSGHTFHVIESAPFVTLNTIINHRFGTNASYSVESFFGPLPSSELIDRAYIRTTIQVEVGRLFRIGYCLTMRGEARKGDRQYIPVPEEP